MPGDKPPLIGDDSLNYAWFTKSTQETSTAGFHVELTGILWLPKNWVGTPWFTHAWEPNDEGIMVIGGWGFFDPDCGWVQDAPLGPPKRRLVTYVVEDLLKGR